VAGEGDCVLEACLWARRVVSWGSEEEKGGEGDDIRLVGDIEEPLLHYLRCAELVPAGEDVYV
jgi:hypothetical protein